MAETFKIEGLDELRRKMAQAGPKAIPYLKQAMWMAGKETMSMSQKEVPVETGTLKNSGQTFPAETKGTQIVVTLGYGGAAQDYALVQHERTDFDHPHGGKAHYLSDPVKAMGGKLGSFLAARIGRSIERAIAGGA